MTPELAPMLPGGETASTAAAGISPWLTGGLGALGAGYSAYQGYNALKEGDSLSAGLSGAGLGAGGALALNALAPSLFAINPLLGAGVMAAMLLGGNELMGGWDKNRWQGEQNRWNDLIKENPELSSFANQDVMNLSKGRSLDDLMKLDAANQAAGKWANPEFTTSRDEAFLKPEDTWGYATWAENYGPKYFTGMSEDQRKQLNQAALSQGLVNEHHGTIDVNYDALNSYLKQNNPELAAILAI
jgi:hypothetical protein